MRSRLIDGVVLATMIVLTACSSGETTAPPSDFDRAALERAEDLTESLANDLLALSVAVRDGDSETVGRHFADSVEATPVGLGRPESHALGPWVDERHWTLSDQSKSWTRDQFIEEFSKLTANFSSLEDTRFKVVESRDGKLDFVIGDCESPWIPPSPHPHMRCSVIYEIPTYCASVEGRHIASPLW